MAWTGVALSAFMTLLFFLLCVRYANRVWDYSGEFCDLYLLKHMLPDGHPFVFMYKGLPRNRDYPRLMWPCVTTFVGVAFTLGTAILAAVLTANGALGTQSADGPFFLACIGSICVLILGLMAIPTTQNAICARKMQKTDYSKIYSEIERKWPGFFDIDK